MGLIDKLWSGTKKTVGRTLCGLALAVGLVSSGNSEASIVEQEYLQTAEEPIITMLDYRNGSLQDTGTRSLAIAQSFIPSENQNFIIDGSLKLARISQDEHNMYLKIWADDNGVPDINNPLGTTTNELDPRGNDLYDYYLSEFGFSAVQVTPGERYWIGLYNPDKNPFGFGVHFSWEYGYMDVYPAGHFGNQGITEWINYDLESRDLGFSVTFSNIPEPKLLEFLLYGAVGGLALSKLYKRNKKI